MEEAAWSWKVRKELYSEQRGACDCPVVITRRTMRRQNTMWGLSRQYSSRDFQFEIMLGRTGDIFVLECSQ